MFSTSLQVVLNIAFREAISRRHAYLTLEHLLYGFAHDPDGERIGAIRTAEICGSVVFGGADLTTLFLTTTTTVQMMPTKVASAPLPGPT